MTNMKPPQEGRNTGAPSLRGLQGRSATGLNGQAAKEEVSALWRGGWMPENISGVPAGRSVFHLTSPLIGLLARSGSRWRLSLCGGPEGTWFNQRAGGQNGCRIFATFEIKNEISGRIVLARPSFASSSRTFRAS